MLDWTKQHSHSRPANSHLYVTFSDFITNAYVVAHQLVTGRLGKAGKAFGLALLNVLLHRSHIQITFPRFRDFHHGLGNGV